MFVNYVPQQLKDNITSANFTVKEWGYIICKRCEGPSRPLLISKLQFALGTFPIIPHLTRSSIAHILLLSSMNWLLDALHSMHHHVAIVSFPRVIAWKAKSPVTYVSTMCELLEQFLFELAF